MEMIQKLKIWMILKHLLTNYNNCNKNRNNAKFNVIIMIIKHVLNNLIHKIFSKINILVS